MSNIYVISTLLHVCSPGKVNIHDTERERERERERARIRTARLAPGALQMMCLHRVACLNDVETTDLASIFVNVETNASPIHAYLSKARRFRDQEL